MPGLEPGHEETGRNVVILVCVLLPEMLPDASQAGLGAEPTAPALSDDVTEAAGLKRAQLRVRTAWGRNSGMCSLPSGDPKTRQAGTTWPQ